ncbi:MAG: carboxypeptidase regulatory-like domain-containing protein [Vicinamibacteraceae bacterium]
MPLGLRCLARTGAVFLCLLFAAVTGVDGTAAAAAAQSPTGAATGSGTGSVTGVVVDAGSGTPLERARVSLDGVKGKRTLSNAQGRFLLADLPAGRGVLEVSLIGYALVRRDVDIPAGGTLDLTLPLAEGTGTYTEDVEVTGATAQREVGVANQITIGSADIEELRSTLTEDPMRAVQTLAGVGGSDDYRSDFSIRAAPFDHLSVTLDGIPSSLLVHTVRQARDTGSLAMLNSDVLDGASVLFGSYPQRYGNRTGSQVDFRMREGSRARRQVRVAVSAIAASGVAEGPIGRARRGSWLITARKSYIDWLIHRIDPDTTGTFGFVDTQAKAVYDLTPRHTITGTMVAGRSRWDEGENGGGLNFLDVGLNRTVMSAVALRSSVGRSAVVTQQFYGVFNAFRNLTPSTQPLTVGSERDLSYRATTVVPGPRGSTFEGGVHLQWLAGALDEYRYVGNGQQVSGGGREHRTRQGAYLSTRLQPHRALTISPGIRVDHFGTSDETLASPWLTLELGLPGRFLVAGGGGLYRQAPDLLQAANPFGDSVRAERARHLDLGVGQEVGAWRWLASVFDRDEDDMLFFENQEDRLIDGRPSGPVGPPLYTNALDGRVRGVEVTLSHRVPNGLTGWIGYAYADSNYTHRFTGETWPSDVEQRHSLTAYGSYRVSDRTSVSARFRAATNVPIVGYYRQLGDLVALGDERNRLRLSDYVRLDLRANRTFDVRHGRMTLFVEVLNATGRRNQRALEQPFFDRNGIVPESTEELLPLVPSAGLRIEF